jgi:hypothetical protein
MTDPNLKPGSPAAVALAVHDPSLTRSPESLEPGVSIDTLVGGAEMAGQYPRRNLSPIEESRSSPI